MGQSSSIFCCTTIDKHENNLSKEINKNKNIERITSMSAIKINNNTAQSHGTAHVANDVSNLSFVDKEVNKKLKESNHGIPDENITNSKLDNFDSLENKKRNNTSIIANERLNSTSTDISNKKNRYENISKINSKKFSGNNDSSVNNTSVILNENEDSDIDEYDDINKEKNDSYTYESKVIGNIAYDGLDIDGSSVETFITTENDPINIITNGSDSASDSNSHAIITTETATSSMSLSDSSSIQAQEANIPEFSSANSNSVVTQVNQNDPVMNNMSLNYAEINENNKMIDGNLIDLSKLQANQVSATGYETLLAPKEIKRFGRKKCLILDLDETLVHSSFKYVDSADFVIPVTIDNQTHHVYVIKRPGVDEFLKRVSELYEVVVFTASVSRYGDPLLNILDPANTIIHHRLFRESCYTYEGNYVKNLSQLGRPLNEIIILDNSPASYIFHPQHAIPISSWFSDIHDNELLDILPLLDNLANPDVLDVGNILDVTI
ncbi:hypothetical protein TPHA_0E03070 [Tetrapisispora phaffii CBS 4417]|uniref:FCP1 homology domain-containing protein n=1 Tax=Tetrapisispora phaffii (strain ATCC 24235 / CBS 4417 / NBRC 1672 / NRRL Y-8282 / UCD 70-5) TaxID=1071381 RepID=G8BU19_TETPH|nr:hypothetical protein TPHA_0E03070 [Tetrapisispora phaffii CBS 4417]CCE63397.1 hypothetical protein TPHA_0E03070 [Tetrapisispora phaffii CBS 4417]